ncbi:PorT family protein [Sphingobacteriales bacterium UPWRP_1]|nr:hypothetical protein B6N25_05695 [Sphingobacteriales bacterium TSM_CSS]PSJ78380.1 PorT family protein [Sphingobacteriales bacterium UPWRP_1]
MKMRTLFAFVVLATMVAMPAFAQKGLEVGVRIIPQSVWIINDDDSARGDGLDFTRTWGVAYGVQAGYNFLDFLGVQTGVLFSGQGQKYVGDGSANFETLQAKLNYLKIPLLLKVNSNPDAGASFVATFGVQYELLTGAKYVVDDVEYDTNPQGLNYINPTSQFNIEEAYANNLSAVFSLGARFRVSDSFNLGLSFRGDYSLTDIENKSLTNGNISVFNADRPTTANLTGGIMIEANYVLGSR